MADFRALGDLRGVVWALEGLAQIALVHAHDLGTSGTLFRDARSLALACGDLRGLGYAHKGWGEVLSHSGRHDQAAAELQSALNIFRGIGFLTGIAYADKSLGDAQLRAARVREAMHSYERAAHAFAEAHDERGGAYVDTAVGQMWLGLGCRDQAWEPLARAAVFFSTHGIRYGLMKATNALAKMTVVGVHALPLRRPDIPTQYLRALVGTTVASSTSGGSRMEMSSKAGGAHSTV
jgi:tetratricopeptide (TPR) repeat protein